MSAHSPAQALVRWYRAKGRDLPWRRPPRTPYRVLLAEIMLQQTRAEVVAPRYEAFLARFPDLQSLASAEEGEVLRHFEGLGYYARGRNLHRLARIVAASGADLPSDRTGLLSLPGIGNYVAHAVLAFAHRQPFAALDANVRRIALRFSGVADPAGTPHADRAAAEVTTRWLESEDPAELHDALMDLGALVCTARSPRCGECPIGDGCVAHASGRETDTGRSRPRREREVHSLLVARVISPAGQAWRPRPANGLLGGMWEPPHVLLAGGGTPDLGLLQEELSTGWGIRDYRIVGETEAFRHVFTHRVWQGRIVDMRAPSATLTAPARWLDRLALREAAIPSAFRGALAAELR